MTTEDDLRTLLTDAAVPVGIAPSAARRRARRLHVRRRLQVAATASVVTLALVAGAGWDRLPGFWPGGSSLPEAFGGDGRALPVSGAGVVALDVPRLSAWADSESICFGDWDGKAAFVRDDRPAMCEVSGASSGVEIVGGVIAALSAVPVVRADFIRGEETEQAQVTGFGRHPQWRILTASWQGPDSDAAGVLIRGWDAAGKLVLSVGCVGGCPAPAQPSVPALAPTVRVPVPAASSSPAN